MSHRSTYTKGKDAFLTYYSDLFPDLNLDHFLSQRNSPVLLVSPAHKSELQSAWSATGLGWHPTPWFPQALNWPPEVAVGTPLPGYETGWLYSLNPASLLPVLALDPQPNSTVLDACAAPGGKTLAIRLHAGSSATIYANDSSMLRFKRLRTTLRLFGEPAIETRNFPAQSLERLNIKYDHILLDAPCSSEKHVYNAKSELKIWSQKRITALSNQQLHLLKGLLPLLKPNGKLVYSTCALTPAENESVIAKLLCETPLKLASLPATLPFYSPGLSGHGLSDVDCKKVLRINENNLGLDPMFIAILTRQD